MRAALATQSLGRTLVLTRRTASTNADLAAAAAAGAPHGTVHTTNHQAAGRGRLDRSFEQPDGTGAAVSVLIRPDGDLAQWSWLPIVVGLATRDAIMTAGVDADRIALKWPNDVLVDGRKIAGILVEAVTTPTGMAAVLGVGVNVDLAEEELPVPTATSLRLAGAATDRTRVVIDLVSALERQLVTWHAGGTPAVYRGLCDTLGREVRVSLPDGSELVGLAEGVDDEGRLIVGGTTISAGDVIHVRPT